MTVLPPPPPQEPPEQPLFDLTVHYLGQWTETYTAVTLGILGNLAANAHLCVRNPKDNSEVVIPLSGLSSYEVRPVGDASD
jgi:hypothetical protein